MKIENRELKIDHYAAETGRIQYRTHKGVPRSLDALDWIALVTSRIPDPHQRRVRDYGRYSNASRGKRRQQSLPPPGTTAGDNSPQPHAPARHYARQRRRNWARLLKKIYEVDPLTCPRCAHMRPVGTNSAGHGPGLLSMGGPQTFGVKCPGFVTHSVTRNS